MIDKELIRSTAENFIGGRDMFVVEITVSPAGEIEVTVDADTSVSIDDCVGMSRAIEAAMDREAEDFELTVASAGIGRPLKMLRQYRKLIGKPVEVVLKSGEKLVAKLEDAQEEEITVSYTERKTIEGSKRKQEVKTRRTLSMADIKSTAEWLDFK